jgi:hypothetical protein
MKKLFVVASCLLITACASVGGPSPSAGVDTMESDGQMYGGEAPRGFDSTPSEARITSTCKIKNGTAYCS